MWQDPAETSFESAPDAKGDEIQKLSVIQSLPNLLAGDAQSCISKVLPKMQQSLPTASVEFHIAASAAFKTILEQKLVTQTIFTQLFLQSILTSLDNKDFVISHYWLKTLLDVIELLSADTVKLEILPVSINKGQLSQPIRSRVMCCKLLGKISTRLDSITIKKEVLPTVLSLCQDVNNEVRACICSQLCFVAEGLGAESTKQILLPSLVDLASDEDVFVRKESVPTIVALLPLLQLDTITGIIIPLVKKICDSALKSDDDVICVVAKEYGKLAIGLEKHLTPEEKMWFVKYYEQISKMGSPTMDKENPSTQDFLILANKSDLFIRYIECRRNCAINIPAMLSFASKTAEGANVLLPTLTELAGDPYFLVRKTIGACIHEISEIMKSRSVLIKAELIKLLNDDSQEVLQGLVPNLTRALHNLMHNQTNSPGYDSNSMPICKALLKCENEIATTNDWRLSALMWAQLEILPKHFSSDVIYKFFVPVAHNRILNARPLPVRLAAGRTLLIFLRYNLKSQQRMDIRNTFYRSLANNNNCYVRMLYLRIMEEAMTIFSSHYMKEHFFNSMLVMHDDRVANIRLKLTSMLPVIRKILRLPADKKLITSIEMAVRSLNRQEQDRDVLNALKTVAKELEDIQQDPKEDPEDRRKYDEEVKLAGTSSAKGINSPPGTSGLPKKHPPAPKLSTISAKTFEDLSASKPTRQGSVHYPSAGSSTPSTPKESSSVGTAGFAEKPKPTGIRPPTSLRYEGPKASSSSFDLTTNWTRLTSNSMLLSQPWEPLRYSSSETSTNTATNNMSMTDALYRDYLSSMRSSCSCYSLDGVLNRSAEDKPSHSRFDSYSSLFSAFTCPGSTSTSSPSSENRRDVLHNLLLTRNQKDSLSQSHSNPYWAFSSMPTLPGTLMDKEFMVDAGISIPQLTSSQSASKIPSFDYQQNQQPWSSSDQKKTNFEPKSRWSKRYSMEYEDSMKQRPEDKSLDKNYIDYEEGLSRNSSKIGFANMVRTKMYGESNLNRSNSESDKKRLNKEGLMQNRNGQSSKRHSMNFGYKPPQTEADSKLKRYSIEVADYAKPRLQKRCSTWDFNHNHEVSTIPVRTGQPFTSRTAPATRASSPISFASILRHKHGLDAGVSGDADRHEPDTRLSTKFSSSEEEIDKLCHKLMQAQPSTLSRSRESRLPVRIPRKKL